MYGSEVVKTGGSGEACSIGKFMNFSAVHICETVTGSCHLHWLNPIQTEVCVCGGGCLTPPKT